MRRAIVLILILVGLVFAGLPKPVEEPLPIEIKPVLILFAFLLGSVLRLDYGLQLCPVLVTGSTSD